MDYNEINKLADEEAEMSNCLKYVKVKSVQENKSSQFEVMN